MTPTGFRRVLAITTLSVAHHVDHVVRGVTGWPLEAAHFVYELRLAGRLRR